MAYFLLLSCYFHCKLFHGILLDICVITVHHCQYYKRPSNLRLPGYCGEVVLFALWRREIYIGYLIYHLYYLYYLLVLSFWIIQLKFTVIYNRYIIWVSMLCISSICYVCKTWNMHTTGLCSSLKYQQRADSRFLKRLYG